MESLVQEVFERSFKENNKKEEPYHAHEKAPSGQAQQFQERPVHEQTPPVRPPSQPEPKDDRPVYANFSQAEDSSKSLEDEFGLNVKEAKIMVLGAGGAGNNCISRLTEMGIKGASTVAINTDVKHLSVSSAHDKLLIGKELTRGLGAGGYPDVGKRAAEESEKDIKKMLHDTDMIYLVSGLGGGTGTGMHRYRVLHHAVQDRGSQDKQGRGWSLPAQAGM
jgi:hypothetical protein